MNRSERFNKIHQMLTYRKVVSRYTFTHELGIHWSTLKRDLADLKNRYNAPIVFDKDAGGYRYEKQGVGPAFQLPGLWFNADEAHALMTMHQLLSDLEPGLLSQHVTPLLSKLETIIGQNERKYADIANRLRIIGTGRRFKNPEHFATVSRATLGRSRIKVNHYSRENDEHSERVLSPQRLVFYRNNWYLDSFCHKRRALRRFSVDAFTSVEMLPASAIEVEPAKLDAQFGSHYGVYGGKKTQIAKLRFSPAAARWVAGQLWHPDQKGSYGTDGHYLLDVPYASPTEIVMDILRHGVHIEVISPKSLRNQVAEQIRQMAMVYGQEK